MGAAATAAVSTVTESWTGDRRDQALVAELCHRLGYEPNQISALHVTADTNGIHFSVTRRA